MRKLWIEILVGVAALTLVPAIPLAQMGPGMGMGPAGAPGKQTQQKPAEQRQPPSREAPTATGTAGVQGASGVAMEHPAASAPFYAERTFLVLVAVVMTAAGFFAYRIIWTRRRRRRGPASFVTEAVLVVDLVESTHLATHYGDGLAMQARTTLKDRTLAATEGHRPGFTESTGDGSFMTFTSVVDAVQTATKLLKDLRDRPADLSPGPPIEVRAGISYGEILLDRGGTRHGAVINRAFRLEGLTREGFAQVEEGLQHEAIPDRNRIFLDEDAAHELRAAEIPLRFVGFCNLKGFSGLHRVYEVLWEKQA